MWGSESNQEASGSVPQETDRSPGLRQLQITCGPVSLAGELCCPADVRGLVLFAHGSGSTRNSPRNQYVARLLSEHGLASLLVDLLTPSEQSEDIVTRKWRFDIPLLTKRLVVATRWALNHPQYQRLPLAYFGASTGSAAALAAAADFGRQIRAVVARGGRPDLAGGSLSRVVAPTLLIVGEWDELICKLNTQALNALHCKKELEIIPAASHLFEEQGAMDKVARVTLKWFNRHLRIGAQSKPAKAQPAPQAPPPP